MLINQLRLFWWIIIFMVTPTNEDGSSEVFKWTVSAIGAYESTGDEVAKSIKETFVESPPVENENALKNIWLNHKSVFRLRHRNDGQADYTSIKSTWMTTKAGKHLW